jgi:hypothetical protein
MDATEWIDRCAARLDELWPRASGVNIGNLTFELWRERRWRLMEPEAAAALWTTFAKPPDADLWVGSVAASRRAPAAAAGPPR